ncbi:MAG TPA: hypothetical protein VKH42_06375 [Vicinamibacterales bacterium]|nr:MAG: hypothetical protein DMF94_03560 [Acidobacteriota bacterium]PYR53391.1 MAG: hypothetical protein DMF95_04200 [Acidobacteriota bacterium]HMD34572.1 hypothetical protein [Vicinamibacterales bacterium]
MGKMFAGFIVAAFVVALGAPAFAATETVKGQIVDQACYKMDKSNTGVDHKMPKGDTKDCAIGCAKAGRPMAILTSDGKVYEIAGGLAAEKNAKIIAHVSHTVEVTGDVTEKEGKMMIAADSLKMISK